jgi:hypothetical protein
LTVAALVGACVGWWGVTAAQARPRPGWAVYVIRVFALVGGVAVAVTLAPGRPVRSMAHLPDGWAGLRDGHVPASVAAAPEGAVLAVPVAAVVLAAAFTTWSAWSGRYPGAWLPSLAVMVLGFLVGDERRGAPLWTAVAWGLLALASATAGRPRSRSVPAVAAAALVLTLVVMVAVPVGGRVPLDEERLRLARSEAVRPDGADHPLALDAEDVGEVAAGVGHKGRAGKRRRHREPRVVARHQHLADEPVRGRRVVSRDGWEARREDISLWRREYRWALTACAGCLIALAWSNHSAASGFRKGSSEMSKG